MKLPSTRILKWIGGVVILIALAFLFAVYMNIRSNTIIKDKGDNISDYSAVFLNSGQFYFGKMYTNTDKEIDLRDVFYLQVGQNGQTQNPTSTTDQTNIQLAKLGSELHGPNDRMLINKENVLFTESLKNDSKVLKAINEYKDAHK